jgi:MFS family permease
MTAASRIPAETTSAVVLALLPLLGAVLVVFLITGLAIPVLPLHVHQGLGLGTFVVGLVTGTQFGASLASRVWSGHYADRRGAKRAVVAGLLAAAASGLFYLLSLWFVATPMTSVTILLLGRAVLGGAESFIITGALAWGLALVAPQPRLVTVLGAVLLPGFGLSLSSLGFGAIITFSTLLFVARGWTPVWVALTAFTTAFMVTRIALGHLPDKLGGAKVALVSILLEAAGLALMWAAPWSGLAVLGAVLTGLGYALVYPGLGLEAVRRVPDQSRGLAMGTYTAFFDLGVGVSSPLLGLIAGHASLAAVFLASTLVVLGAAPIAARLWRNRIYA